MVEVTQRHRDMTMNEFLSQRLEEGDRAFISLSPVPSADMVFIADPTGMDRPDDLVDRVTAILEDYEEYADTEVTLEVDNVRRP